VLYQERPAEISDPGRAAELAYRLAERVGTEARGRSARLAFHSLTAYAAGVDPEGGYVAPDLSRPRRDWEALRAELFRPSPWFRAASAELEALQRRPEPAPDPEVRRRLEQWARAISTLVAEGGPPMMSHGEELVDAAEGSAEERRLILRWRAFAEVWDDRVERVAALAPAQPGWSHDELFAAHQELSRAMQSLRHAAQGLGDYSVPPKYWREQNLESARALAARVEQTLRDAPLSSPLRPVPAPPVRSAHGPPG
jgi:hypothetical protein